MDETACLAWLERHLHPAGLACPHCGSKSRRAFRPQQAFPAYRCHTCDGYYTLLTNTVFKQTRQQPSTLVLLLWDVAQGETTARLSRELNMSYNQVLTLRQRFQDNANETAPMDLMEDKPFESDKVYQNAGKKSDPHLNPLDPPRRRGNAKPGHGTFANDRSPVFPIIRRETGEVRVMVCGTADKETCQDLLLQLLPPGSILYSDELRGYQGWPDHFTVCYS